VAIIEVLRRKSHQYCNPPLTRSPHHSIALYKETAQRAVIKKPHTKSDEQREKRKEESKKGFLTTFVEAGKCSARVCISLQSLCREQRKRERERRRKEGIGNVLRRASSTRSAARFSASRSCFTPEEFTPRLDILRRLLREKELW
jgi:hypothetical protein